MSEKAFPLEPIEKASIDELRSLQLKRLKQTLQHAYANSPVYRAKFDAAGVHPDDLHSLADLAKFPFTGKQDLRDSYPWGMFAVPREQWPDDAGFRNGLARYLDPVWGDRRQEIVFIGADPMDQLQITAELDDCLVAAETFTPTAWEGLADPFARWA